MSKVPAFINALLKRPPILADEDTTDFQEMFDEIWQQERPQTFHEWALVADIATSARLQGTLRHCSKSKQPSKKPEFNFWKRMRPEGLASE